MPLDDKIKKTCEQKWFAKHGFHLSAGRLLVTTQMHVMHVMSHAVQKDFSLLPIRRMRLQDGSLNDCKEDFPHIVFMKLRAFLMSMAFINIDNDSFFNLQAATEMEDKVFPYLHKRYVVRPPCSFYIAAWEATARIFQTAVRSGKPLTDAASADSAYQHHWTVYMEGAGSSSGPGPQGGRPPRGPRGNGKGGNKGERQNKDNQEDDRDDWRSMQRSKDLEINRLKKELSARAEPSAKRQKWQQKRW